MYISKLTCERHLVPGIQIYDVKRDIYSLFPGLESRRGTFTYRVTEGAAYVNSTTLPVDANRLWNIESRPFVPNTSIGTVQPFMVRVNATIDRTGRRVSVTEEAVRVLKETGTRPDQWPNGDEISHEALSRWFKDREGRMGFKVTGIEVKGQATWIMRLPRRKPYGIDVYDLMGTLVVTDPKAFEDTLLYGIGDEKGFGCGMIVVKG